MLLRLDRENEKRDHREPESESPDPPLSKMQHHQTGGLRRGKWLASNPFADAEVPLIREGRSEPTGQTTNTGGKGGAIVTITVQCLAVTSLESVSFSLVSKARVLWVRKMLPGGNCTVLLRWKRQEHAIDLFGGTALRLAAWTHSTIGAHARVRARAPLEKVANALTVEGGGLLGPVFLFFCRHSDGS